MTENQPAGRTVRGMSRRLLPRPAMVAILTIGAVAALGALRPPLAALDESNRPVAAIATNTPSAAPDTDGYLAYLAAAGKLRAWISRYDVATIGRSRAELARLLTPGVIAAANADHDRLIAGLEAAARNRDLEMTWRFRAQLFDPCALQGIGPVPAFCA
jgi:hypothetical protein